MSRSPSSAHFARASTPRRKSTLTDTCVVPNPSFLESGDFPALELAEFATREGRRPRAIYTAHKWFARRLACVFRGLLVGGVSDPKTDFWDAYYGAADLQGVTVLDPFVGGGTSVVEASRLGAAVIGIDIDPVACAVTRFELEAETLPDLRDALRSLQASVGERIRPLYMSVDAEGRRRTVLHHFWVQAIECRDCGRPFRAHPTYLLAEDRETQWVVYERATRLCADRKRSHPHLFPLDPIAEADRFDSRLLDYGYRRWTDLFNNRQLLHLSLLAEGIAEFDEPVLGHVDGATVRTVPGTFRWH